MKSKSSNFQETMDGMRIRTDKKSLYKTLFLMTKRSQYSKGKGAQGQLEKHANLQGLTIEQQNKGGGNCMFLALSQQLRNHGVTKSHKRIRQELVEYLRKHGIQGANGTNINLPDFMYDHDNLESYLQEMAEDGVWGDNIMLLAFANLYSSDIFIISSASEEPLIIQPMNGAAQMSVALGHIHKMHYLSLAPLQETENNENDSCNFCETDEMDSERSSSLCPFCGRVVTNQNEVEALEDTISFGAEGLKLDSSHSSNDTILYYSPNGGNNNIDFETLGRKVSQTVNEQSDIEDHEDDNEISVKKPHPVNSNCSDDTILFVPQEGRYKQDDIEAAKSELSQAVVDSITTLTDFEDNPEVIPFGADHYSGVWAYFMEQVCTVTIKRERMNDEEFYMIDFRYLKSFDYFREVLNGLPLTILFITPLVKRFLRKYSVGKVVGRLLFLDDEDSKTFKDYMTYGNGR